MVDKVFTLYNSFQTVGTGDIASANVEDNNPIIISFDWVI